MSKSSAANLHGWLHGDRVPLSGDASLDFGFDPSLYDRSLTAEEVTALVRVYRDVLFQRLEVRIVENAVKQGKIKSMLLENNPLLRWVRVRSPCDQVKPAAAATSSRPNPRSFAAAYDEPDPELLEVHGSRFTAADDTVFRVMAEAQAEAQHQQHQQLVANGFLPRVPMKMADKRR